MVQVFLQLTLSLLRGKDEEPWNAKGSVKSDLLTIVFSEMLQHADFEGATYKRVP